MAEERWVIPGREITLRSADVEDAEMFLDYVKAVTGESRFLICESDEVTDTAEGERDRIKGLMETDEALLMLVYVDGDYAGGCSFEGVPGTRKSKHRAQIGIALLQRYTGFGLGRLLRIMRERGFEQAELTVTSDNARAIHLYESLGFEACGRIPNANKYDDGTYSDDVLMVMPLRDEE